MDAAGTIKEIWLSPVERDLLTHALKAWGDGLDAALPDSRALKFAKSFTNKRIDEMVQRIVALDTPTTGA